LRSVRGLPTRRDAIRDRSGEGFPAPRTVLASTTAPGTVQEEEIRRERSMKKLAAASISALMMALLVGLVAVPASAQSNPPEKPTCEVSDSTLGPGDTVTITGDNWQAGSTVTFTLQPEGINIGSATVGADGSFTATVTIPDSVQPGSHSIVCSGIDVEGNNVNRGTTIQVLGGAVGAGGTAFTGSTVNVPLWIVLIVGLFVAGLLLVTMARRRRRSVGTGS